MNLQTVADVLYARVDELCVSSTFYGLGQDMKRTMELQRLIQACGYDTSELQQAITATDQAVAEMERARKNVVTKFKTNGVFFIVDERRRAEMEQSSLQ